MGSQATVCGGGRYDGLVEQLGGSSTPAIGWAWGWSAAGAGGGRRSCNGAAA